jgi:hypothetical protein
VFLQKPILWFPWFHQFQLFFQKMRFFTADTSQTLNLKPFPLFWTKEKASNIVKTMGMAAPHNPGE